MFFFKRKPKETKQEKPETSPVRVSRAGGRVLLVPKIPVHPDDEMAALKDLERFRQKWAVD